MKEREMRLGIAWALTSAILWMFALPCAADEASELDSIWTRARNTIEGDQARAALAELEGACDSLSEGRGLDRLIAAECQRWIGEQRLERGELDAARTALTRAHALYSERLGAMNPLSGEVLQRLAEIYAKQGDLDRAELAMARGLMLIPALDQADAERGRAVYRALGIETSAPPWRAVPPDDPMRKAQKTASGSEPGSNPRVYETLRLSGNRRYHGFSVGGIRSGYGLEIGDGAQDFWRGQYSDGSLNDRAIWFRVEDGAVEKYYAGAWKNGRHDGYGTSYFENGNRYTGSYRAGQESGYGEFRWSNGSRYVGSFEDANLSGFGTLIVPGMLRYEGHWKNGERDGVGVEVYADGLIEYRGEFVEGEPHGQGRILVDGREIYDGPVDPQSGIGFGRVTYPDGGPYVGQLLDGRPQGFGIQQVSKDSIITGIWQDGRRVRDWPEAAD
jgi:hypothetical protein